MGNGLAMTIEKGALSLGKIAENLLRVKWEW